MNNFLWHFIAHADGMTKDEIFLQLLGIRRSDALIREESKTGVDPIESAVA